MDLTGNTLEGNVIKTILMDMYRDAPEIQDMLRKIDLTTINRKFYDELALRIDLDEFDRIVDLMASPEIQHFNHALQSAVLACTQDISNMIDFVMSDKGNLH